MTKEESLILKGVAILLMLFLHLFNNMANVNLCTTFLSIGDIPLVLILTRAANPVSFFLILSGYGMYIVVQKNPNYNVLRKLRNLYIHYWISLAIFVGIGAWLVGTSRYPGSLYIVVENVTAWYTSWNGEIWFLFPYMLLALSAKWIFKVIDRVNPYFYFGTTLAISLAMGFCISRYGDAYFYHHQLAYMPILYFSLLFAFSIGALIAKFSIVEKCKIGGGKSLSLLILLVAFRCMFRTGAFHTFYVVVFIILFLNCKRAKLLDKFLLEMGRRSTSMWFVHTYFAYYIFHDFIYGFKYPLLIFVVLLGCSYASALVMDGCYKRFLGMIKA